MHNFVGIDLGTTYSCIGVRRNENVESVSALVFDVDDPKGKSFEDIFKLVNNIILYILYNCSKSNPLARSLHDRLKLGA